MRVAVRSNVLIFERIREELRSKKTVRASIDAGYEKAFWTVIDSHVTTLITAMILFQFGTGPIKGFAVTLSMGVAINLFTALVCTKVVFDYLNEKRPIQGLGIVPTRRGGTPHQGAARAAGAERPGPEDTRGRRVPRGESPGGPRGEHHPRQGER